jgi:flagellar basal-body rod modification protein FlgD
MASAVSPLTGSSANSAASSSSQNNQNSLTDPSEGVFLNLLVAQIQNQDPLNPTDSTQFVTQLAQFSELEQLIGIHNDTDTLVSDIQGSAGAAAGTANTNSANTSTQTNSTNSTSNNQNNTNSLP